MDDDNTVEIEDSPAPDVVDNGDGSSTVTLGDNPSPPADQHDDNLALSLPESELDELARKYLELIEEDVRGREPRDKQYADGLKKTGIAEPAPGGAPFEGASRATHPVLAEAYIDFSASSIKELFPPNGPVRTKIEGTPNHDKLDRAMRKAAFMNKQLTQDVREYRGELERLLTQLGPGGEQYMKVYWSAFKKRVAVEFVPIDDFIIPYNAKNFFDLQRKFHRMHMDGLTLRQMIDSGVYVDYGLPKPTPGTHEETKAAEQTAKIEGKETYSYSDDVDRIVYEGVVYEQLEGDDVPLPYLLTIDDDTKKVLGLYKMWAENDADKKELDYIVNWTFIPWRGALGIGLPQLIGGLADALTGSLRALLDSALIANSATAIKLKSSESGTSTSIDPTQVAEVDGMGADDIRKIAMPLPFPGPSMVLFQLLGFLTSATKEVVGTAQEKIADAGNQMPVGTALALIEQGAKVFSSIHARLHDSQRRVLEIIHRLNAEHIEGRVQFGSDDQDYVTAEDFQGVMDVHPVSDPNIFSETQRFAQIQAIIQLLTQLAAVYPQIMMKINVVKLIQRSLEMMKFPNYEEILPPDVIPIPTNPADENVNLVMGKAVKAFPGQDHQAHIQVHLDFATNPYFGMSPAVPPTFGVGMMNHIEDHLLNFYLEMMKLDAATTMGADPKQMDFDNSSQATEALAKASAPVMKSAEIAFQKIPGLMQQAKQYIMANAPKPPMDPMAQVAMADVQAKAQAADKKLTFQQQQHVDDMKFKMGQLQEKLQGLQNDYNLTLQKYGIDAQTTVQTTDMKARADLEKTDMQNQTAKEIEGLHVVSDHVKHIRELANPPPEKPKESP